MVKGLIHKGLSLWNKFAEVNAETYASSISYFAFLSFVPTIALCISLVSLVGIGQQEVVRFFAALMPDAFEGLIRTLVNDAYVGSGIAFSLSSVTLIWSASRGVKAMRGGLNVAYGVQENRSTVAVWLISIVAILALGLLAAALMYLVFSGSVLQVAEKIIPDISRGGVIMAVSNPLLMLASGVFILSICYAYLPAGTRRFSAQLPGAAFAALACGVLSFGFRVYVEHFGNYTVLYGSIATIALMLLWMFLVSYTLIAGGFVNRMLVEGAED